MFLGRLQLDCYMIIGIHGVHWIAEGRVLVFGPLVIAYLFLGGTGAGACLVASAVGLLVDRCELADGTASRLRVSDSCKCLLVPSLAVAVAAVFLGLFCLFADLGSPLAALGVITGGATSWANFGVLTLAACIGLGVLQIALLCGRCSIPVALLRVLQVLGIAAGFGAAAYTGLLLMDMTGVPLWSSPWLPVLFTLSAVSCGLAVFVICAVLAGIWDSFPSLFERLALVDIAAVALESTALALFLVHAAQGGTATAIEVLLSGGLAPIFWVGVVFAGLVVPIASEVVALRVGNASPYHLSTHVLATAAFALVGAACLRYCVVMAGAHPYLGALGVGGAALGW